jgi:hypothetical protein
MDKKKQTLAYNALRAGAYKLPARNAALKKSFSHVEGRSYIHKCEMCKNLFKRKEMQIDHILSVVPLHQSGDLYDLNEIADRMYCDESGWQHICIECHNDKTQFENHLRMCFKSGTIKKEDLDSKLLEYLEK